ncbi:hypothetical protein C0993_009061 [Termitomyces sp. T159_Od127]|nr:hypothetical protein C0993_009061 [Termitomyces sp. T159_Od127]
MSAASRIPDQPRLPRTEGRSSPASVRPVRKTPIVYPALLSRVAEAFRDRIALADKVKDGLTYKDAFDGREAVDKIAYIIKTTDRNLALLLGRALDAQKFFHDVTYDHRLRDSATELYHFRTKLPSPFVSGELASAEVSFVLQTRLPLIFAQEKTDDVPNRPRKGSEPGTLWIRQKSYAVVERIGDVLLDVVPHFGPFVQYGSHQLYGKYEFEKEKNANPAFAHFVETTERLPESRKLELNAYLTKPTTRLARYPLLLEAVLKHTPDDSPDKMALLKVIAIVRDFLRRVNEESGKTENRFNLMQLEQQLVFRPGEHVVRALFPRPTPCSPFAESVSRRGGAPADRKGHVQQAGRGHPGVHVRPRHPLHEADEDEAARAVQGLPTREHTLYPPAHHTHTHPQPIPLELLLIAAPEDAAQTANKRGKHALVKKPSVNMNRVSATGVPPIVVKAEAKGQNWINFMHLGRKFYNLVLWAPTPALHRKWLDLIVSQQTMLRERSMVFDTVVLNEGFFHGPNRVNCAAPFNGGRKIVYGTNDGVYFTDLRDTGREPTRVLALLDVSQVDVLEDYQLLIVLSGKDTPGLRLASCAADGVRRAERQVITFPLDALDPNDPLAGLKRAKRISSHTSFFKAGFCLGRVLVCIVKSSQLSSTFKTLEPIDQNVRGRAKPTFRKLLQGGNDTLKLFREFYIPVESTSIHYLKTKMCVGCSRGFEIVDLESLDTQGLLDPNDENLEFVRKRENLRPMAIYRIHNEFLLCYDEFAFYVNKNGRQSRKDFMVHWEGNPTGFGEGRFLLTSCVRALTCAFGARFEALHEPYVLAFEPSFVEVRHIETGHLEQVIQGANLRLLFADTPPSVTGPGPGPGPVQAYAGYEYVGNPYAPPPPPPPPGYAGYGAPPYAQYQHQGQGAGGYPPPLQQQQQQRNMQGIGRDEILIVSDDRVLALRPTVAAGSGSVAQRLLSDSASMVSFR